MDYRKKKEKRLGLFVDWMETYHSNASLQLVVRKGWGLNGLNDWKSRQRHLRDVSSALKIYSLVINIILQKLLTDLDLYWIRNIPLLDRDNT